MIQQFSNVALYYILTKEIQEFLTKIKLVFLSKLKGFISSREINPCRLVTFSIAVTYRPYMYNLVPVQELLKMGPVFHALKWMGKVMMGYLSMSKPILSFCLSGYCSQRILLMSNKSPGIVHFSNKTLEATVMVGDANRNETLDCCTQNFRFFS